MLELALAASLLLAPPPEAEDLLTGRILGATPMMADLHELTDRIGGRITGTPACESAVAWAEKKFKEIPLADVKLEPFTIPKVWTPKSASAACVAPAVFPLAIAATPGTGSTPDGRPVEGPVVNAGMGSPEEFAKLGERARGAIALVHNPEMKTFEELFGEYMKSAGILAGATQSGVAAVLIESSRPRDLLYRHPMTIDGTISPIPVAIVAREQAQRLFRLLADGEVRARVAIDAPILANVTSRNVVAAIRGSDKANETVVVGAHLDAWDLGTGANDNGVSCAQVIDLARQMQALGLKPRRTILFILFTGEEQGMFGSRAWVHQHAAQLDDVVANVIFDTGSGRLAGFYLDGREDVRPALDAALARVASLGPFTNPIDALDGTDNFDFLLAGIPNYVGAQDPAPYLPDYHASSDTYDKVDAREAKSAEAVLAAVVWGLANSDARPGPRQTRAEVEQLIRDSHLDEQMKAFGQWEDWAAGKRGVAKR